MNKKNIQSTWRDFIDWQFCGHCGHPIAGVASLNVKVNPIGVKPPKPKRKGVRK